MSSISVICIVCVQLEVNNISIIQSSQATQGLLKLSEWTDVWDFVLDVSYQGVSTKWGFTALHTTQGYIPCGASFIYW